MFSDFPLFKERIVLNPTSPVLLIPASMEPVRSGVVGSIVSATRDSRLDVI